MDGTWLVVPLAIVGAWLAVAAVSLVCRARGGGREREREDDPPV